MARPSMKVRDQKIGFLDVITDGGVIAERILINELVARGTITLPASFGPITARDITTAAETGIGFALNALAGGRSAEMARAGLDLFNAGFTNLGPMLYTIAKSQITNTARAPGQVYSARNSVSRPRVIRQSSGSYYGGSPSISSMSSGGGASQHRVTSYQGIAQTYGNGGSYSQFT